MSAAAATSVVRRYSLYCTVSPPQPSSPAAFVGGHVLLIFPQKCHFHARTIDSIAGSTSKLIGFIKVYHVRDAKNVCSVVCGMAGGTHNTLTHRQNAALSTLRRKRKFIRNQMWMSDVELKLRGFILRDAQYSYQLAYL